MTLVVPNAKRIVANPYRRRNKKHLKDFKTCICVEKGTILSRKDDLCFCTARQRSSPKLFNCELLEDIFVSYSNSCYLCIYEKKERIIIVGLKIQLFKALIITFQNRFIIENNTNLLERSYRQNGPTVMGKTANGLSCQFCFFGFCFSTPTSI